MSKSYKYIIDVAANNQKFVTGMQTVTRQVAQTDQQVRSMQAQVNSTVKSFRNIALVASAAGAVTAGFMSLIQNAPEAYNVQAQAEQALLTGLKGRVDVQRRLIKQASELQGRTLFGDEETVRAQSLIAMFVKEEEHITRLIPLVQDFAQVKQMSLASAADLVTKTFASSTNALARYGIEIEGSAGSAERLESIIGKLNDAYGGQAEDAAGVGTGAITQLKNAYSDLGEEIGRLMVSQTNQANSFVRLLTNMTKGISGFTAKMATLTDTGLSFSQAFVSAFFATDDDIEVLNTALTHTKVRVDSLDNSTKNFNATTDQSKGKIYSLNELQQKQVDTYGQINERLKQYNDLLGVTSINNTHQIALINAEVIALQAKKKALDGMSTVERVGNMDTMSGLPTGLVTYSGEGSEALADMQNFINGNIEAVKALQFAWMDFGSQYDTILQGMYDGFEDITMMHVVAGDFINQMMSTAKEGAGSFEEFAKAIGSAARSSINAFIAEGVAGAVSTALAKSGIPFPLNMVAGAVAAAGATTLLNAAIPKFANGGIVSGPTIGMIGEYPGAKSNPEVIAPLNKLRDMINPSGGTTVIMPDGIDIDGYKLRILLKKVEKSLAYRS